MNEIIRNILCRRSIRACAQTPLPDDVLKAIVDCGLYAPTGHNEQNTRILVIRDPETLSQMNAVVQKQLLALNPVPGSVMNGGIRRARTPGYHFIHGAPVLISVSAPRDGYNSMAECAAAVENMLLAASSLGLAACWSNQPHWFTAVPEMRAFFEPLGLREDEDIFASLSLAYPKAPLVPSMPPRKEGRFACDIPLKD